MHERVLAAFATAISESVNHESELGDLQGATHDHDEPANADGCYF